MDDPKAVKPDLAIQVEISGGKFVFPALDEEHAIQDPSDFRKEALWDDLASALDKLIADSR